MHTLLFLALVPSAPAPPEKADKLQGIWKVTAVESRGTALPPALRAANDRSTLVVVGNEYVFGAHAGTVKFDLEKKTADLTITEGRYKGIVLPGLIELSGDTLKLAIPTPRVPGRGARAAAAPERPKDLKTDEGTSHTLYAFERDAKATKEQVAAKMKELKEGLANPTSGFAVNPVSDRTTQDLLRQIVERLDRIEKRLDEMEKKQSKPEK
jgi:uncharacterized protein (TIGR03067 family)